MRTDLNTSPRNAAFPEAQGPMGRGGGSLEAIMAANSNVASGRAGAQIMNAFMGIAMQQPQPTQSVPAACEESSSSSGAIIAGVATGAMALTGIGCAIAGSKQATQPPTPSKPSQTNVPATPTPKSAVTAPQSATALGAAGTASPAAPLVIGAANGAAVAAGQATAPSAATDVPPTSVIVEALRG